MALQLIFEGPQLILSVQHSVKTLDVVELQITYAHVASALFELDAEVLELLLLETKLTSDGHHLVMIILKASHVNVNDELL